MLEGLQKVENRLIGVFSCCFGMLSEKVLLSELSKVVRKIQFALFRKIEFPKNKRGSFPLDRPRWLCRDVVNHTVDAVYFVNNTARHTP